jgi:hypothetical protein
LLDRSAIEEVLGIGRSRFFALLSEYRHDPDRFSITYERRSRPRLPVRVEAEIEKELTIIARAKSLGCYQPHPRKKVHDREVITTAIGALIQHDASHHHWSPYAGERWVLIISLDDFSLKLLYADLFGQETTWAHIKASESVMLAYVIPLRYYVNPLRVFRFVQGRDSVWRRCVLQADVADPQWRQVMRVLGVDVAYALSPQAKSKVERLYRWLQDRIVRTCAIEKLTTINEVCSVLKEEVDRYNNHQVHSTTGEVPSIRFEKALTNLTPDSRLLAGS